MSGRNRQRYTQRSGYTRNSHGDIDRSSSLRGTDVPVTKPYEFPSFLQAGEPPQPLNYFHQAPELEIERRGDTATISSRYTSSQGHLLLASNQQECVYKAIAWDQCFKTCNLGDQGIANKGICILSHKTACANYRIGQRGPYVCCGTPTFEIRWGDSN
ncbi:hypothetical protein sscle_06g052080 [Sclerotinia sclerotiorum 1980 UF-70]|uniref:Uncharacterized protein n=1 Tax=Sclerotinia sclerotiorum (strain ATCC 18683 / 1980 / Ss-1) TaxID=665079 RepID=A0A1D9Q664_SCLS1|nr:hypothetical protein sscle_06g052080 [Sclerotinia sclerotiorum 1980 UF-70]